MRRGLAVLALLATALSPAPAAAVLIDFEGFGNVGTTGPVVTTQFPEVTFSAERGSVNVVTSQPGLGAGLNFICTALGLITCTQDTFLTFTSPVRNLTFLQVDDNQSVANSKVAEVDVFESGAFAATVDILGDASFTTPNLVDLTAFDHVTSIRIHAITDPGGLGWDNFSFDVDPAPPSPTTVPEPATLTLVAASLAGAGLVAWRRSCRRQKGSAAS
jgi:hypothetical protein